MNERNQKEKTSLATSLNEIVYLPENQININGQNLNNSEK